MELLEINEAIKILKCNAQTFRTWLRRGLLPDNLIFEIGKTKRVRKNILEKWVNGEL